MIRSIVAFFALLFVTPVLGVIVVTSSMLRIPHGEDSIYQKCSRFWASMLNRVAGVRIVVHDPERIVRGQPRVYVSNHVSWFDVFVLGQILPNYTFIAKRELSKIPIFGWAATGWGVIWIDRGNRKSAFDSYKDAASAVRGGQSVVICAEGTRGDSYELRPFKKGPFVFAISARVPIVPVVVYGAREVQPRGSFRLRPGTVHVHPLDPVSTEGYSHEERDQLVRIVWTRMADAMERLYGVHSRGRPIEREAGAA
jgi:1-acyl-sn-glycerol-3-phosphate acyltransferase